MPFTVIEAMSMGIPVISSKAGGLIDLLGENYPLFRINFQRGYYF